MGKKRAKVVLFLVLWLWLSYKLAGGFDLDRFLFSLTVIGALLFGIHLTSAVLGAALRRRSCDV